MIGTKVSVQAATAGCDVHFSAVDFLDGPLEAIC